MSSSLQMEDQTSELQDGTLVDLCGATLLWRSAEGLSRSPTKHDLERMVDQLNAGRPQCPVSVRGVQSAGSHIWRDA